MTPAKRSQRPSVLPIGVRVAEAAAAAVGSPTPFPEHDGGTWPPLYWRENRRQMREWTSQHLPADARAADEEGALVIGEELAVRELARPLNFAERSLLRSCVRDLWVAANLLERRAQR